MSDLFDLSEQYAEMLQQGLRLSGEDQEFFILGRIQHLKRQLPHGWKPRKILDFGCGTGNTAPHLAAAFPEAEIVGVDTAENAVAWAESKYGSPRLSFRRLQDMPETAAFDLCYTNGVFHHIAPLQRPGALRRIRRALRPGGHFALFENNPWNPGTRMVMSRIPFDRDAETISPLHARALLLAAEFRYCAGVRSLFYFPRPLAFLRFAEPWLARIPLGAQYCVLATK
jgi:SAM-dependent methyltransferase